MLCRKRPTVIELLDHPWLTTKVHIPQNVVSSIQTEMIQTPKSTPILQPKIAKKTTTTTTATYNNENINGGYAESTVRTYTSNYLCPQCGATCRHLSHSNVTKTPITVDRGILC